MKLCVSPQTAVNADHSASDHDMMRRRDPRSARYAIGRPSVAYSEANARPPMRPT